MEISGSHPSISEFSRGEDVEDRLPFTHKSKKVNPCAALHGSGMSWATLNQIPFHVPTEIKPCEKESVTTLLV